MNERRFREHLYPTIEPYETGMLPLDELHTMFWEQSGNPNGLPVIFLHGGPGAGATAVHRRFFDPATYRIIIFDQRGAGRSSPRGELRNNTTAHLVDDIDRLCDHLGVESCILFGGSWGSTLALAFAEASPNRCIALIIRGIFLGSKGEIAWFTEGLKTVFPEAWRELVSILPSAEQNDLLGSFHRRVLSPDPDIYLPAARAWSRYEGACSTLFPSPETVAAFGEESMACALARIETHYFINENFLAPNALLDGVGKLADLPCTIIQGRYDMICPIITADKLHRAWPGSEMIIVPNAGHSAMDAGIVQALVATTERYKHKYAA